jgi:hypothetical protein
MNTTIWTGMALAGLGLGGLVLTEATLAATTAAVLGLVLMGLGVLMRHALHAQASGGMATLVALLGLLTALNSFGRAVSEGGLRLSESIVITIATAAICSLYLARWGWEQRARRQDGRP